MSRPPRARGAGRSGAAFGAALCAIVAVAALAGSPVSAQTVPEDDAASGPGRELFIARCSSCHSVDYIRMHAPFGTRALWEASVNKMRNAFKAPLEDEDARAIVDYLSVAYGPESPAARAAVTRTASADDRQ